MSKPRFFDVRIRALCLSAVLLWGCAATVSGQDVQYSLEEAKKVLDIIWDIQEKQQQGESIPDQIVLTESELNAYIAHRIKSEESQVMRELSLKILEGNNLEGKVFIDLQGQKLPRFMKPQMNLYFSGTMVIRDRKVKLKVREIYLEGQKIQPLLFNMIVKFASRIQNGESSGIDDWYELPYGITNIKTQLGEAHFYFQ